MKFRRYKDLSQREKDKVIADFQWMEMCSNKKEEFGYNSEYELVSYLRRLRW